MSKEIEEQVLQRFELGSFLGSGAYGHVWKVTQRCSGRELALKKVFDAFQNAVDAQRTYRQVSILHEIDHDNVIKLRGAMKAKNGKDLYLIFEYMETDLHAIMGQGVLGETHLRFVAYQMFRSLKYLHSAQLIHRDLKSSNILINSNCEIKLCDFGLVRSLAREEDTPLVLSEDVATRWYRSPQMLLGSRNYGKATDMWSLGCILAELVIGDPIFPGSSTLDQIQKILQFTGLPSKKDLQSLGSTTAEAVISQIKVKKRSVRTYFKNGDQEMVEIVMKLLEWNPDKRLTAEEGLQLPCLQQFRGKCLQESCRKFIVPEADDNLRLGVEDYRRLIYKDIQRRYPQYNNVTPVLRFYRSHNSLKARSTFQPFRRIAANSLIKLQRRQEERMQQKKLMRAKESLPQKVQEIHSFYGKGKQDENRKLGKIVKRRLKKQLFWSKLQSVCD